MHVHAECAGTHEHDLLLSKDQISFELIALSLGTNETTF
jgi:hypothetical protein